MAIKLFIKEHISYIIFQICVTLFILSLFWLDGFRNIDTAIYAVVISIVINCVLFSCTLYVKTTLFKKIMQSTNIDG